MNRPRQKAKRRVARNSPTLFKPAHVIRIHTEGRVTERDYLSHWARLNRGVRIDWGESGVDPMSLVRRARQEAIRSRANRRRLGVADFDEVWCVFDVDTHSDVALALSEAERNGINVAVSNPCLELWLVLHLEDRWGPVDGHGIQRRASRLGLVNRKSVSTAAWKKLAGGYEDAKRRAQSLDQMHRDNESPSRPNPSTDVWRLVDRIRSHGSAAMLAAVDG